MPRNKYPEETVKKILDVSLRLFLEKGYEQTTVLDIVDNLGGLTRGAFYHHFKTKEEVIEAIFTQDSTERDSYEKIMKAPMPNGLARFKYALKTALSANVETEKRTDITGLALSLLSNPRFLAEHIKAIHGDATAFAAILEEGMADGSIKQGNPRVIAELFLLLVNIWLMPNIFPCSKEDALDKMEIIEQIFQSLGYDFIDGELGMLFRSVYEEVENKNSP
ncbi:MAG: TetR/AcrR family transcriptional regulator [Defluviitaleaceae bacterium]|nr:TetR/AcrR family transcriptional regulator [Defluviitaleaceae bacterium]